MGYSSLTMSKEQRIAARHVPAGAVKVASKKSAKGFYGSAMKAEFNIAFRGEERRVVYVAKWLKECDDRAAWKAAQQAEKKAKAAHRGNWTRREAHAYARNEARFAFGLRPIS